MNFLTLFKGEYNHDKLENLHIHIGTDLDNLDDAINGLGTDKTETVTITKEKAEAIRKKYNRLKYRWTKDYLPAYEAHDAEMAPVNTMLMLFKMLFLLTLLLGVVKAMHSYGMFT